MNLSQENNRFRHGLRDGFPIGLGYIPVSFAFGIFATGAGLSVPETVLISLFNMTSAGQMAAVPLLVGGGSLFELFLSQLFINMRYALMSVSLSQVFGSSVRPTDRLWIAFGNTDEIFAVSMGKESLLGRRYYAGLLLSPLIGWTLGTLLGAMAGNVLPARLSAALSVAIYAMFLAILVPPAKKSRPVLFCILLALVLSCVFSFVPYLSDIPEGFRIILCGVLAAGVLTFLAPLPKEDAHE